MGNKQSNKQNNDAIHTYTSITTKEKPDHIFMSDDNICIVVNALRHQNSNIALYWYSAIKNKFIEKLRYETQQTLASSPTAGVRMLYDPFHNGLIYWNQLKYHQFNYKMDEKSNITYTIKNGSIHATEQHNDIQIVNAALLRQGNLLLFVLSNATIIIMQWNKSKQKYESVTQFKMEQCDNIIGITVHEQRAKMALLKLFDHHYYLNIYYIGDMLRYLDNSTLQMKSDPTYIHKPKLLLSRLVYRNPIFEPSIICQFSNLLYKRSGSGDVMKHLAIVREKIKGATYVVSNQFGIHKDGCELLFSKHGDKILYQVAGTDRSTRLHRTDYGGRGHAAGSLSGWLNDFGGTHMIDCNTGTSLWSTGEPSKDIGRVWTFNDYLVVFKTTNYRCSFNLVGFQSETVIAECLFNDVIPMYGDDLKGFEWGLCLLVAELRGATESWHREITLCKYEMDLGRKKKLDISLDINTYSRKIPSPINAYASNNTDMFFAITIHFPQKKGCVYETHFYDLKAMERNAFSEDDVLIKYDKNNGLICRNLANADDKFREYFRRAGAKRC